MANQVTLIEGAIHNPGDLRHFMVFETARSGVTVTVMGTQVACAKCDSDAVVLLKEVGKKIYDPVFYFSQETVEMALLEKSEKTTQCPLKGTATYYHLRLGERLFENIAWSYEHVLSFDRKLEALQYLIAFDPHCIQISKSWANKNDNI